mmetsp:Transcript_26478/g.76343  ORF Transcript_26478/g.76343 Transcript_26478/m.76343 type:complete len:225 (-) Transcript_26478:399-1073(-)
MTASNLSAAKTARFAPRPASSLPAAAPPTPRPPSSCACLRMRWPQQQRRAPAVGAHQEQPPQSLGTYPADWRRRPSRTSTCNCPTYSPGPSFAGARPAAPAWRSDPRGCRSAARTPPATGRRAPPPAPSRRVSCRLSPGWRRASITYGPCRRRRRTCWTAAGCLRGSATSTEGRTAPESRRQSPRCRAAEAASRRTPGTSAALSPGTCRAWRPCALLSWLRTRP